MHVISHFFFISIHICRQGKRRDGCCCCIKLRDDYSESTCGKRDILQELMDKYIGQAMLSLPGKVQTKKLDERCQLANFQKREIEDAQFTNI